jgi:hypothetical protein
LLFPIANCFSSGQITWLASLVGELKTVPAIGLFAILGEVIGYAKCYASLFDIFSHKNNRENLDGLESLLELRLRCVSKLFLIFILIFNF